MTTEPDAVPPVDSPQDAKPAARLPILTSRHAGYAALGVASVALVLAALPYFGLGGSVRTSLLRNPQILAETSQAYEAAQARDRVTLVNQSAAANPQLLAPAPGDAVFGPADAKVTVVEFFDYRCPGCKATAPDVIRLMREHPDVRFIFKDWPILDRGNPEGPSHAAARLGQAAVAAGNYVPVFLALMESGDMEPETLAAIAAAHGVPADRWTAMQNDPDVARRLMDADIAGQALGLIGTPTFFINGRTTQTIEPQELERAIQAAKAA